jgi:oligopeptide/dipeptide ABC transporter ATP-binding protein
MNMPLDEDGLSDVIRHREYDVAAEDEAVLLQRKLAAGAAPAVEPDATVDEAAATAAIVRGRRQWPLPKLADPAAPLLVVRDLRTWFKLETGWVKAVDGVSFRLNDGEALGLAGESGCGKTTTALSLVGLLPTNARVKSGSIELFGIDLVPKTENQLRRYRWREVSIVFQGAMNALNPVRRIGEQIAEPIEIRLGEPKDRSLKRAGELLELVGIPAKRAEAYPHELSGGMRQRAMIAMALACDPAIVIGDEPTTALDVMVQAQILQLLERLRRELGLSLILITHDLSVIAETCDRTLIMYAGKVAEEGPVARIFTAPRHPYTQKLLGAFPNIHADRRSLETIPGSPPDLRNPPPGCRFHPRCPFVMDVCREVEPPEALFPDGVRVACHLHPPGRGDAVAVTPEDVAARGGRVATADRAAAEGSVADPPAASPAAPDPPAVPAPPPAASPTSGQASP